ncbi:MAG: peptide deformylase [Rhodospirillales bacterium]|nr:peptide deformylase [Rhodospirillales bacterium]
MAILKIARMGHPVLSRPADPVEDPTAPEIGQLVRDMIETMEDAGGTGLAAPQVHVPKRVVVFFVSAARAQREDVTARLEEASADAGVPLTVLINPEIEAFGAEQTLGWEACLSVPGLTGEVPRYTRIRYRGLDLEGNRILREASGFHARVVQHECDHLEGMLYPQRMTDLSRLIFTSEMKHMVAEAESDEGANAMAGPGAAEVQAP